MRIFSCHTRYQSIFQVSVEEREARDRRALNDGVMAVGVILMLANGGAAIGN